MSVRLELLHSANEEFYGPFHPPQWLLEPLTWDVPENR